MGLKNIITGELIKLIKLVGSLNIYHKKIINMQIDIKLHMD